MSGIPLVDRIDYTATCLACTLPDCIYCIDEPAIELRRQCPIWVRERARQKPVQAAYMQRKRAGAREARVSR